VRLAHDLDWIAARKGNFRCIGRIITVDILHV
jgi:hypothetical protein